MYTLFNLDVYPTTPLVLTSSGGTSGWYASYWNATTKENLTLCRSIQSQTDTKIKGQIRDFPGSPRVGGGANLLSGQISNKSQNWAGGGGAPKLVYVDLPLKAEENDLVPARTPS